MMRIIGLMGFVIESILGIIQGQNLIRIESLVGGREVVEIRGLIRKVIMVAVIALVALFFNIVVILCLKMQ